jgi:O-acetyl-ADP-ribose deacetylase
MEHLQIGQTRLELRQGDITTIAADVLVNAANAQLAGGSGVNGAIRRAGGPSIAEECQRIGGCATGSAVITGAGRLPARHVVHAVAPVYRGRPEDAQLLHGAYAASLRRAEEAGARSIAFPSLGTGVFGYPIEEAAPLALDTVAAHVRAGTSLTQVLFVLYSRRDYDLYARLLADRATARGEQ